MEVGWNFRREHLRLQHRSHSVIVDGGDQPNVVPPTASIWFYFRERNADQIRDLFSIGEEIARGAAMMTGTELARIRIIGSAWQATSTRQSRRRSTEISRKSVFPNGARTIKPWRMPYRKRCLAAKSGLPPSSRRFGLRSPKIRAARGYADDIGDISWNVPTATLSFPSNIPGLPGHNWSNAIAIATPIAHKGATAGAKVHAMTVLDFLLRPELVEEAWDYFRNVQVTDVKYEPFIRPDDEPAIERNQEIMNEYREAMKAFYYDASRYDAYMKQLGAEYPTLRRNGECRRRSNAVAVRAASSRARVS